MTPRPSRREVELGRLSVLYEEAVRRDLDPRWHADYRGFDVICPGCRESGRGEHRTFVRAPAAPEHRSFRRAGPSA